MARHQGHATDQKTASVKHPRSLVRQRCPRPIGIQRSFFRASEIYPHFFPTCRTPCGTRWLVHTAEGRGAPPFWGWGVAAPAPVRDGRAPANRSLGDSWFTNCEYARRNGRVAGPTHHRKMDRFASVGMPRPLVAPLPKALASQHHDHSLPLRPWSIGARTLLRKLAPHSTTSDMDGRHIVQWASFKRGLTFVEPLRIT